MPASDVNLPLAPASPPESGPPASQGTAAGSVATPGWFRQLTLYGVLGGLCPLIPIPFLDDRCLDWVQRRMASELLERHRLRFSSAQAAYLVGIGEGRGAGCLRVVVAGFFYLLKKIFRKVVFIFTLKDCVDRFSETFHQGYLLERCVARGAVAQAALDAGSPLRRARQAILMTVTEVDPRPVNRLAKRAFRDSRRLLIRAAARLGSWVRRHPEPRVEPSPTAAPTATSRATATATSGELPAEPVIQEEEGLLGSLVDRLSTALFGEADYLESLERLLGGHLQGG